jgi:Protein of unknown function (DUF1566)
MNWATATGTTCTSLTTAGRTWRLPSSIELETLPDYGTFSPTINTGFFPATTSNNYWSSTTFAPSVTLAWYVSFNIGIVIETGKASSYRVRCVSGDLKPATSFTDNGDGTIKDKQTGLTWQKCSVGQDNNATCSNTATSRTWTNALSDCNTLTLTGRTWRLPSLKELQSIMDKTLSTLPSINTSIFPATANDSYWSSNTSVSNAPDAWFVSFNSGGVSGNVKTVNYYVRCVSGP